MTDQSVDDVADIIEDEAQPNQRSKITAHDPQREKKKSSLMPPIARWCGSKDPERKIIKYLDHNQETLEVYIINRVSITQLQEFLVKKMSMNLENSYQADHASLIVPRETSTDFLTNFEDNLVKNIDELSTVLQLARYIKLAVPIDAYRIFKIERDDSNSELFYVMDSPNKEANHLLYQPMLSSEKAIYVMEMWRIRDKYDDKDEEICANVVTAFHYFNLYLVKKKENSVSIGLLNVVQAIFNEMVALEPLIKSILKSTQGLVNADRTSLLLVDSNNPELVSTVFQLKFDQELGWVLTKSIGLPINPQIAGYVASSGQALNIPNAYSDDRFDSELDKVTGYTTRSILCMPIKFGEEVIGVVEMINKLNNCIFNNEDEVAFQNTSIFFGLALNNAKLYNDIKRNEQRYKVALEILSYHNTCQDDEVQKFQNDTRLLLTNLNDYYLDPYKLDDFMKYKATITMFDDLFKLSKFDSMAVTKFILTVKKNYRLVPYHNFMHGWSVTHAMYVMLKNIHEQRLTYNMKLALFVACLCHDLDHRGFNNNYLNDTKSPLAAMYSSSPLENHHFSITVTILQQDGHNIFSHLPSEDYKEVLQYIKQCILATDINTAFFPNLAKLNKIVSEHSENKELNWEIPSNRNLVMGLLMTAADLSASAKPWAIHEETVKAIFEEFHNQGDKERKDGRTPIPMMDRNKPEVKAVSQVGFLNQICIPCYSMLCKIFPQTKPMYEMAMENLNIWQSITNNDNLEKM
ncbi:probable 3',5'-cyclic phosphodiesterase pde-5 isoform X2 [Pararge aegeria]|uniref:probable 3',5'-cyclic phosphodiesterase pde-5 isoform X2 n=1 Tax=Pararge aegeria TaxID=116150 RepID=UPI0019D26859|nr:probable 3',5'-cyclic phosphodiesterase pde-5 isoform X2 [Pararge aegeria]